jgi:hypothetical protein
VRQVDDEDQDDDDQLQDRFFRERRLLLGISVVLLAHQLLGITVDKGAETLGLHFDIENPSRLWWALWAVWGWAFVCCVQQVNALKPWRKYPGDRDEEMRVWLSDRVVLLCVRRRALKHLRENIPDELRPRIKVAGVGRKSVEIPAGNLHVYARVSVEAHWNSDGADLVAARAQAFQREMEAAGWRAAEGGDSTDQGVSEFHRTVNVRVMPIQERSGIRALAFVWTMLSTPFFTDYLAPIVIGMAPLIVAIVTAVWEAPRPS